MMSEDSETISSPTRPGGQDLDVSTSKQGLTLLSSIEPAPVDGDAGDTRLDIDVVHVLGVSMRESPLALSFLSDSLPQSSRRREYHFDFDVSGTLSDDLEFTKDYVEFQARQLLDGLLEYRRPRANDEPAQRVTIFFAYDIGAVILKKAISIASDINEEYSEIFASIAKIIFTGCFNRGGERDLGLKILTFLNDAILPEDGRSEAVWKSCITLSSVQNLVSTIRHTNEAFLASKISSRCTTFSLYAGTSSKRIHGTLGYYFATLGLSSELAIEEVDAEGIQAAFPNLMDNIGSGITSWASLGPSEIALEQSLLSLAAPEAHLMIKKVSPDHPVLKGENYDMWCRLGGTQVIYLEGTDSQATTEAAEQMSMDWIRRQQLRRRYFVRSFEFRFCASDPARNSTMAMLTACFLHFFRRTTADAFRVQDLQDQLRDQFKLQNAWTDDDLCNMALNSYIWMYEESTFVLIGLDECDAASRRRFWTLVGSIASRCENRFNIIVAGNKPGSYDAQMLREELKYWPEVNILNFEVPQEPEIDVGPETQRNDFLARLCSPPPGSHPVKECLERLQSMNPKTMSSILDVVKMYSRWPADCTKENFRAFLDTTRRVDSSYTPEETAWKILSSVPCQEVVMSALTWIIAAQRPLTLDELASFVAISRNMLGEQLDLPKSEEIRRCSMDIDKQIRGFAVVEAGQFRIHSHILELLADAPTQDWEALRKRAPRLTAEVLLQYLRLEIVQERLHGLFRQYEERVQQSGHAMTPPLMPDGKDMLFYAVQALPHHLSGIEVAEDIEAQLRDPSGPYEAWSKVYWAMSNPFARPHSGPLKSAWRAWTSTLEFGPPSVVRLRDVNGQDNNGRPPMDCLAEAVRANNQDLAISFAEEVISDFQNQASLTKDERLIFPPSILWRAAWLDMDRLLDLVLSHSEQQDDSSSASCPSMLFLASRIGCSNSVDVLLKHKGDTRLAKKDRPTALHAACGRGHLTIVQTLLKKDLSMINTPHPSTLLYVASFWGCWEIVETLLESGADPNQAKCAPRPKAADDPVEHDWTPITAACHNGLVKTVRMLLKHGADPETPGPWGADTCLYLAAVNSTSLETTKVLLEHGADPNHKNLEDPLLTVIIYSKRIPENTKLEMFELLLNNDPPVNLERGNEEGVTPLMDAAATGRLSATQCLLDHGASVDARDSNNYTALFWAIFGGHWEVARQLLRHHDQPVLDLVSSRGYTLLQTAIENVDELRNLLEAGADPSLVNRWQQNLLDRAVVLEKTQVVKMLLETGRGVDLHHRDCDGYTPIMVATGYTPNEEITRMLMEAGSSLSETTPNGSSPLHLAAWKCRPDVLQVLLDFHDTDDLSRKSDTGQTPLVAMADFESEASLECIRLLVRAGVDINSQDNYGNTLLTQASSAGPGARAVHDWLLARPTIDIHLVTVREGTALHVACMYGDEGLVSMLLQKGARVNSTHLCDKPTPLIAACMPERRFDTEDPAARTESAERIVRTLITHGADASLVSGISIFNALCAAAFCAGVGTINFILDKAASARTPDPLGRLPIHFAAANGVRNFEAVALAHGGDIMAPDRFGKNALHWAAQFGKAGAVRAILHRLPPRDRKRCANSEDADGWTPLAWASRPIEPDYAEFWTRSEAPDYEATIQHLLEHGADIHVRFRTGRGDEAEEFTPLLMARRYEADAAIIELLTPRGQDGEASADSGDERVYRRLDGFCDFCFAQSRGVAYRCETCTDRYWICKKCLPVATVEHPRTATFEGPHTFDSGSGQEFVFQSKASSSGESGTSGDDASRTSGDIRSGADVSTAEFEPMDFPEGDIEQLEFPDLQKLGGLEDL
ncbi:hypothetical protein KVR01_009234 [Diaporthe batatas]|uniref:uncharacterized protein n=1 Tax=Diaporthe batatas TaxID=748121 RepID=UPI001D03DF2E|nr:uncharacterized protein KVR01_009234 [Diaporthe batatas]KAG8160970.1 hypothetical protein KVR01_009234 [Diaporthe batatas]